MLGVQHCYIKHRCYRSSGPPNAEYTPEDENCAFPRFHVASPVLFTYGSKERDQKEIVEPAVSGEVSRKVLLSLFPLSHEWR